MKIEIFRILRVKPMATSIKHLGNRENLLKVLRKGRLSGRGEKQRVYGDGAYINLYNVSLGWEKGFLIERGENIVDSKVEQKFLSSELE